MLNGFPEADWKVFRRLREVALERYYKLVLDDALRIIADADGSLRDRYLRLYDLMRQRDKDLARAFDDFRRSTALMQIGLIWSMGLWTDDEIAEFSQETRNYLDLIAGWDASPG